MIKLMNLENKFVFLRFFLEHPLMKAWLKKNLNHVKY